jgi:nitrogen fixation protein
MIVNKNESKMNRTQQFPVKNTGDCFVVYAPRKDFTKTEFYIQNTVYWKGEVLSGWKFITLPGQRKR